MRYFGALLVSSLLSFGAVGCGGDDDVVVIGGPPGTLSVEWTIAGAFDPASCALIGADAMELVVFDSFGQFVTEVNAPCESFFLTIDLEPDVYFADATLVDVADNAVTVTSPLDNLDNISGTELAISVDFPPGSVL